MAPSWRAFLLRIAKQSQHHNHPTPLRARLNNVALRTQRRLWTFRYSYLSALKERAQSHIWNYLAARRFRKRQPAANAVFASLCSRGFAGFPSHRLLKDGALVRRANKMAAYTGPGKSVVYDGVSGEPVGQGSRRKRMAGYLKAANEMRQSYFGGEVGTGREGYEDPSSEGGAFPDAAVVRSGNEEMILFPSYARKHVKSKVSLN